MKKKLELTNYNIDKISEITEGFLYDSHVEKAAVLRIKFTLEELLLKYQEAFGEKTDVTLNCTKRLGALKVELVISPPENRPAGPRTQRYSTAQTKARQWGQGKQASLTPPRRLRITL